MADDISNKTIVVLVILTVIISLLGTLIVMNEVSNMKFSGSKGISSSGSSGKVELTILPAPEKSEPDSATGMVSLEILPEGNM